MSGRWEGISMVCEAVLEHLGYAPEDARSQQPATGLRKVWKIDDSQTECKTP